jgi:hypothetical protein
VFPAQPDWQSVLVEHWVRTYRGISDEEAVGVLTKTSRFGNE